MSEPNAPEFLLADDASCCTARGDWTLAYAAALASNLAEASDRLPRQPLNVDAGGVTRLDTAGALLLLRAPRRASARPSSRASWSSAVRSGCP